MKKNKNIDLVLAMIFLLIVSASILIISFLIDLGAAEAFLARMISLSVFMMSMFVGSEL